jgi:hypothetical protein
METDAAVNKRMIFCLSPGRCGTKYLMKMLETIPGVIAKHEPVPRFSDVRNRSVDRIREFWTREKLPVIRGLPGNVYVETSHVFKLFADSLLDLGIVPDVIVLWREPRDVALSLWRRQSIPGRTRRGREFLIDPRGRLKQWGDLADYQLCYWYVLESVRECERIGKRIIDLGGLVACSTLDAITTRVGFSRLVYSLGLDSPRWILYDGRRDWRVNANPQNYYNVWPEGNLDRLEAQVCQAMT